MTTTIHAYSSYVHEGKKLQAILRHADGTEMLMDDGIAGHRVVTHHVHSTCELVFREVDDVPAALDASKTADGAI